MNELIIEILLHGIHRLRVIEAKLDKLISGNDIDPELLALSNKLEAKTAALQAALDNNKPQQEGTNQNGITSTGSTDTANH